MSELVIRPLTPDLWPALEDLFGPNGAVGGCWCMYWRIGNAYRAQGSARNRAALRRIVKKHPPGLLALDGEQAVGWCQVTPRAALPRLESSRVLARVDDVPVWSVSCFYVRRGHRRQGVMGALIHGAVKFAKAQGAPALEAYPWDDATKPGTAGMYTGVRSVFVEAGFTEIARGSAVRPIMRYEFGRRTRKKAS